MPGTAFSSANWTGYDEQSVTNPSAALTAFSLMIDVSTFSATWKSNVQSDGADIRITKGDGTTELAYDLIDWAYNAGAPTGWIRTLWSGSLATSGTQNVRVWAGYTGGTATAYGATETYGSDNAYDANWVSYWPLEEASGTMYDRIGNNDATLSGAATSATGKVGNCIDFTSGGYVSAGSPASLDDLGPVTLIVWAQTDVSGAVITQDRVIDKGYGTDNTGLSLWVHTIAFQNTVFRFNVKYDTVNASVVSSNTYTGSGTPVWYHVAATWDGSSAPAMYKDGSSDSNSATAPSGSRVSDASDTLYIGNSQYGSRAWQGGLDEVQVHTAARSAAWIAEEYAQTNNQATFWGSWAWTATGGGSSIAAIASYYAKMRSR